MNPTWQFWLNWITQVAIAVGTIGAVVVALFGGWFRVRVKPPKLSLRLENECGFKAPVFLRSPNGDTRQTEARWYHVRVENKRRWSQATQVQVFLLRVEEPNAADEYQTNCVGELPMRWRDQEVKPVALTLGYPADCDLCSIVREKWLELHPLVARASLNAQRRERCRLMVTLQARSLEAYSDPLRVEIVWDGKWADDTEEMRRHMVVRTAN